MTKPNELQILRVYDAPLKAVWDAWTDIDQVKQWWGPRGFTLTSHSKDLRPGGTWDYTMHGPDGTDWPNVTTYLDVVPMKKLVYDHGGSRTTPPLFRVTVLFSESNGKTLMDMTMTLETAEKAKEIRGFIKKAGGNGTWDRLAEFVEKGKSGKHVFVINRTFDAPLERLWDAWTRPEVLSQWLPPTGFIMRFIRSDIRPGGTSFYSMSAEKDGSTMYGNVEYVSFEKPNRLMYKQRFADKDGNVSRHPGAPTWPETMLTTVDLSEEAPGRTRVTVTWEPVGAVTDNERAAFVQARAGMTQGWTGSFDKLEDRLTAAT